MKSKRIIVYLLLSLLILLSACSDEKEKGNYSGVSDLIADRNRARYDAAENNSSKKQVTQKKVAGQSSPTVQKSDSKKNKAISSVVLYEQEIEIVGVDSGKRMAKGIAYVNKQGQIVRIKILRE